MKFIEVFLVSLVLLGSVSACELNSTSDAYEAVKNTGESGGSGGGY